LLGESGRENRFERMEKCNKEMRNGDDRGMREGEKDVSNPDQFFVL
jgi:hypothetical protein